MEGLGQPLPPGSQVHPSSGLQASGAQTQPSVPQAPGYPLPGLGQAIQPPQGRSTLDRDREILREAQIRERQRHQDEMAQREREHQDRERERQHREPLPQQNHAGAITIHQPVASKVATAIHGPGGLLSGVGTGAGPNPPSGLPHSTGSANLFGAPLQGDGSTRSLQPLPAQTPQSQALSFGGSHAVHPLSSGVQSQTLSFGGNHAVHSLSSGIQSQPLSFGGNHAVPPLSSGVQSQALSFSGNHAVHPLSSGVQSLSQGLPQGQQPILNDALSYLDQVKVQFVDQPDVYNRFLDIMKDFKSQAIDTPGVIDRVSTLFAGHPNLIQGFNTFLPPGYRIECGAGDDPNAIRVTTPMGTTVSSMPSSLPPPSTPSNTGLHPANGPMHPARQGGYYEQMPRNVNPTWQQQQPQPVSGGATDSMFGPNGRSGALPVYGQQGQGHGQTSHGDGQTVREPQGAAAGAATVSQHQQEQRGVSQLQNAVSAATGAPPSRQQLLQGSPNGGAGQLMAQTSPVLNNAGNGASSTAQSNMEKRGPVEFNHAISYVNKIKNRFSNQPDIYKQFLEILQTYQRESKPIQDVYAQVTHLFNSAPDLLEDFKQFLPESAAQAKAQAAARQAAEDAAILSNVRGEPGHLGTGPAGQTSQQTPGGHRSEIKMPPVGNFAPPPSNKKRRGGASALPGSTASPAAMPLAETASTSLVVRTGVGQGANANKRTKLSHTKSVQPEVVTVSPSLTPALPEPLPPTINSGASPEELAFFDRVKKFIANKQTMNEFLKLCNLFSQDLIDKSVLVGRVSNFIGGNPELMTWFKRFVGYDSRDEVIENRPRAPTTRVSLSNCRGYGPSYRFLPIRERLKVCSGRDEMCHQVLNDTWASHPTWASEDSGFTAHRKNVYEEALHRIEEERHDYDFNIEANLRTIQLLEPIALSIARMTEEERANFTLAPGIGGQSTAIYQRIIKKLYGRERGQFVIDSLLSKPCAVVPVLLARLKAKDEEWRSVQREWEKVWREQTNKLYYKSLDHMGINAKTADKKQFAPKTLTNEIQTRYEEQRRARSISGTIHPKYQLEYRFHDAGVVLDACRLLFVYMTTSSNVNVIDRQKLEVFVKDFITMFFDILPERFEEAVSNISSRPLSDADAHDSVANLGETSSSRGRATVNGKKIDLLRGVLDRSRNGKPLHNEGENGIVHGSKETTPDISSAMDEDFDGMTDGNLENGDATDPSEDNWTQHPGSGIARNTRPLLRDIPRNEPFTRETYSLYCSTPIYCFFRMLQILYERLLHVKQNERQVVEDVRRAKIAKPADDLQMVDKKPEHFFERTDPDANYYAQVLDMIQDVLEQRMEMSQFEEVMRHFYLQSGWQLYAFDRLFNSLARFGLNVVSSDAKDKSNEIIQLFYKDREKEETTHQAEINYRKQVEKLVKDGDVYRIEFNQPTKKTTVQILRKDDATFDEETMSAEARWSYYVASFIKVEPTEGVPIAGRLSMPFLKRNLPEDVEESEGRERSVPYLYENNLELRICVNSYKILWTPRSGDWFVHSEKQRASGSDGPVDLDRVSEQRRSRFREKLILNNKWMREVGQEEVDRLNEKFQSWIKNGPDSTSNATEPHTDEDLAVTDD